MELKLNIREGGKVVKTYTTDEATLTVAATEDVLDAVDIDSIIELKDSEKIGIEVLKIAVKKRELFKRLTKEMFPDITDEEYQHASVTEVVGNVIKIVTFAIQELFTVGSDSKN